MKVVFSNGHELAVESCSVGLDNCLNIFFDDAELDLAQLKESIKGQCENVKLYNGEELITEFNGYNHIFSITREYRLENDGKLIIRNTLRLASE